MSDAIAGLKRFALEMRSYLCRSLADLTGGQLAPPELHRELGLERKLAWKLSRFLREEDVFLALSLLPGRSAFASLTRKMIRKGLPKADGEVLLKLYGRFEELVEANAGSRASFDLMLQSMSEEGLVQSYASVQKNQFSANSYLLGIQSSIQFATWFLYPSDKFPEKADSALLRGILNLQRNRPRAPFVLNSVYHGDGSGKRIKDMNSFPVEEDDSEFARCSFLREFCSDPLPELVEVEKTDICWRAQLAEGPVGRSSLVDLVSADVYHGQEPRWKQSDYTHWEFQTRIKTPAENFQTDLLVHRSLLTEFTPELTVCQDFTDSRIVVPLHMRSTETAIPVSASIRHLGSGSPVLYTPVITNYDGMVLKVVSRTGWNLDEMEVFRVSIEYPVTPSSVYIKLEIPGK